MFIYIDFAEHLCHNSTGTQQYEPRNTRKLPRIAYIQAFFAQQVEIFQGEILWLI